MSDKDQDPIACFEPSEAFLAVHPRLERSFYFGTSGELDTIAAKVRAEGLASYENPTTDIIIEICRRSGGLVLDIGANTGLFALAAAAANDNLRVCAFEPLETVRSLLESNIALNPDLARRIAVEPFGLSSSEGTFSFYETINNMGLITTSSSLEKSHATAVGGDFREQKIHTKTLDDWFHSFTQAELAFMKIDVEGHEHAVISGGRRTIHSQRPLITLEVLGSAETRPLNSLLVEEDYLAFAIAHGELRHCENIYFHPDAWNHLLCPAEKVRQVLAVCRHTNVRVSIA